MVSRYYGGCLIGQRCTPPRPEAVIDEFGDPIEPGSPVRRLSRDEIRAYEEKLKARDGVKQ